MKTITVPKSIAAETLLDMGTCPSDQVDQLVLSQEQFNLLWSMNFFDELNQACGSIIDDFEDDTISSRQSIEAAIALIRSKDWSADAGESIKAIESLLIKAGDYSTSIHFDF